MLADRKELRHLERDSSDGILRELPATSDVTNRGGFFAQRADSTLLRFVLGRLCALVRCGFGRNTLRRPSVLLPPAQDGFTGAIKMRIPDPLAEHL